jgi:hypothetical protein
MWDCVMWVSRKKFEDLERRVNELEKRTSMRLVSGVPMAWKWDKTEVSIDEVVEQLVKKVGLLWQSGVPGKWI